MILQFVSKATWRACNLAGPVMFSKATFFLASRVEIAMYSA